MTPEPATRPQRKEPGCIGKGCLGIIALVILLGIALTAGAIWGVHRLREKYSATARVDLPVVERADNAHPSEDQSAPAASADVNARWQAFQRAGTRHEKARIELTAADINALIEGEPQARGEAVVAIENDLGRVRFSVPLGEMILMQGRYLNGEATVAASPDGDPAKARITNISLANQSVPDDILNRRVFGWLPIRTLINQWLEQQEIATFSIRDNKVIGETRGGATP